MKRLHTGVRLFAFTGTIAAALGAFLASAEPASAAEPTIARLGNGLEVVLLENHSSPMIAATMVVRAGADLETASTSGASHMMEHLLFNGTERRTQKELYDEADLYGIYNNATTRRTHTDYFVLASKDRIREAMDIQADMLFHSTFPPENFEKEKGIVLEEMGKDEQDPGTIAEQLFRNVAFGGTPYARPILGSRKSIEAMSREDVVAYYHATYVPSNMTLFVMGDFAGDSLLPVIDTIYGGAPAGRAPSAPPVPFPDLQTAGAIRVFHGKTEKGLLFLALPNLNRLLSGPSPNEVLAAYAGKRLQEELVEGESPLLFSVDASYEARDRWGDRFGSARKSTAEALDPADNFGRLLLTATFDPSRAPEDVASAILASLARIGETEPSSDEIERFLVSMKASDVYLSEKPHMYGMMKAEEIARGGYGEIGRFAAALDSLRPKDVAAVSGARAGDRRAAAAFLPGDPDYTEADLETTIPGETPVWNRPEEAGAPIGDREGPAGKEAPSGALTILRAPEKGEAARAARSERVDTTLANGLRVVVLSNDDSRVFALHLLAKNRSWQEPAGRAGIADLLHRLLVKGAGDADGAAFRARLERIGAEVKTCDEAYIPYDDFYTTPAYSFVRFTTLDDYEREGIDLFADMIRRPLLAEEDVASAKEEMITLARGRLTRPSEVSEALLARVLYDGGPLAADPEGSPETIEPITRAELLAFREMYFAPDNLIVTAVTSLDARSVAGEIARRFEDAPRFSKRKPAPPALTATTADARLEDSLGAKQGSLRIGAVESVPVKDRPALTIAVSILSDEIAFDLRETRGLAYSVGAGVSFEGEAGVITASIGTAAGNFAEAEQGIRGHFDRFGKIETPDPLAIEKAVNAILGRMNMRRLSRPNQAYREGLALFTGRDEAWLDNLRGTSAEEVARAARTYIRSSPAATVLVR